MNYTLIGYNVASTPEEVSRLNGLASLICSWRTTKPTLLLFTLNLDVVFVWISKVYCAIVFPPDMKYSHPIHRGKRKLPPFFSEMGRQ